MESIKFKFIDSPKLSAMQNMDFDKSLLDTFDGTSIFRLYCWEKNSFSLGRFQDINSLGNLDRYGSSWAKRITGGGVLLHGNDISYSLVLPTHFFSSISVKESYEKICSFIFDFYLKLGFIVSYAKDLDIPLKKSPFCQVGFEPYDIIINGKKIGGNAQRRTKKLIFQHGSIPIFEDKREHSGVSLEELGIKINEYEAKKMLKESFTRVFMAGRGRFELPEV